MSQVNSGIVSEPKQEKKGQGIGQFFRSIPAWALFLIVVSACIVIAGLGSWIGQVRYQSGARESEQHLGTAVAAILGLLAFMLGFTFSLTWSRYSNRNTLVIQQAKALEACYLHTSLLPENQRSEIQNYLKEYIDILLVIQSSKEVEKLLERLEELHASIWRVTSSLAQADMDSELRSQFISSVKDVLNIALERRIVALKFRIPAPIWSSLLVLAGMGMLAFGYQTGITGSSRTFDMPLVPIAFGVVIVLISDLNSSGVERRFQVTKEPLLEVKKMIEKEIV
ncbi:DUF4239 domain-containing protein [Pontibacter sp. KCTC 32443]|uniref:bestrophin-like domain n=1 Tax=Pontibacter TaxID=323449 RepID=UPI00164ED200|nr:MULTISPECIES: DUF4239 domain-containing protein [Pontibacter]MBC5773655.1 DUF4239 domain-containing protein [Pontibacter sp. KCTC 32443]